MLSLLTPEEFSIRRREKLLDYLQYTSNFELSEYAFAIVTPSLISPHPDTTPYNLVEASAQRASCALTHLANCYSGGHTIADLRSFFPTALQYWEEYARYHLLYHATDEYSGERVAHIALLGADFYQANRLICFAVLLGLSSLIPRILPIIEYNNTQRDGMLDRIVALVHSSRGPLPDKCTRHLPYFKTLKIFSAPPDKRPEMMAEYLSNWYYASRREPYYDSENQDFFTGYWSYEAAAITFLLRIDDSSYQTAPFYPQDLVDFSRSSSAQFDLMGDVEPEPNALRSRAGDLCPESDKWLSLDAHQEVREHELGEKMADLGSPYGLTVWKYIQKN